MARDGEERNGAKKRKRKQRRQKRAQSVTVESRACHGDVTQLSSPCHEDEIESDKDSMNVVNTEGPGDCSPASIPIGKPAEQAEILYQIYPRKVGKAAALTAIRNALKRASFDELKEAVSAYAIAREGQEFTPNPSTWFNQDRWEDDRSTWRKNPPGHAGFYDGLVDFVKEGEPTREAKNGAA